MTIAEPLSAGLMMMDQLFCNSLRPSRSFLVRFCGNGFLTFTLVSSSSLTIVMAMMASGGFDLGSNLEGNLKSLCLN